MLLNRRNRTLVAEINVVPYIDVTLVLLLVFMITAPMVESGVEVDLPSADATQIDTTNALPVIVTVDRSGLYYLNVAQDPETSLDLTALMTQVVAHVRINPNVPVMVRGDRDVAYGEVIEAMAILKQVGIAKVGLMTQGLEN
jgi:biopolymer transport protein TolR